MSLDWLRRRLREAGAPSEDATERDGFLSYAAETHSIAYGFAIGAALALRFMGVPWVLELTLAALGGVVGKRRLGNDRVWREITDEPQYFLPSIAVGFGATAAAGALLGVAVTLPV